MNGVESLSKHHELFCNLNLITVLLKCNKCFILKIFFYQSNSFVLMVLFNQQVANDCPQSQQSSDTNLDPLFGIGYH